MKLQIHNNHVYPDTQAKLGGADTMVTFYHHHPPTIILFLVSNDQYVQINTFTLVLLN